MKSSHASLALALSSLVLGSGPSFADTVWAPMWDQRAQTSWTVQASSTTVKFATENEGKFDVYRNGVYQASGDTAAAVTLSAAVGEVFEMRYTDGFHVRPYWEGVSWAKIGPGSQAAGPNGNVGFQSDAELGFDGRWGNLPSQYADTTWYYHVAAGERLRISVEHMTGDIRGAKKFEWVRPDGTVVSADADGMPGSGGAHYAARGGSLANAPDPNSVYWDEYLAPEAALADGWWGFKLTAYDLAGQWPYSWHYVLDRTDSGDDQFAYLRLGSIADPNRPLPSIPEPATVALMLLGLAAGSLGRKRRQVG